MRKCEAVKLAVLSGFGFHSTPRTYLGGTLSHCDVGCHYQCSSNLYLLGVNWIVLQSTLIQCFKETDNYRDL